jgi:hypothetical protein
VNYKILGGEQGYNNCLSGARSRSKRKLEAGVWFAKPAAGYGWNFRFRQFVIASDKALALPGVSERF